MAASRLLVRFSIIVRVLCYLSITKDYNSVAVGCNLVVEMMLVSGYWIIDKKVVS